MLKPRIDILLSEYEKLKEYEKENQRLKDINFKQEYELENRMMKIDYLECEVKRLNKVLNGIDKILIEHIDECREELNIIYKNKDLEYINQCSKEFNVITKNIEMIISKINELKESD